MIFWLLLRICNGSWSTVTISEDNLPSYSSLNISFSYVENELFWSDRSKSSIKISDLLISLMLPAFSFSNFSCSQNFSSLANFYLSSIIMWLSTSDSSKTNTVGFIPIKTCFSHFGVGRTITQGLLSFGNPSIQ